MAQPVKVRLGIQRKDVASLDAQLVYRATLLLPNIGNCLRNIARPVRLQPAPVLAMLWFDRCFIQY
jgi:hypothetical protein